MEVLKTDKKLVARDMSIFSKYSESMLERIREDKNNYWKGKGERKINGEFLEYETREWGLTQDEQNTPRRFIIPIRLLHDLDKMGLARDVATVLTGLWYQQGQNKNCEVNTSYHQITKLLGFTPGGWTTKKIEKALDLLMWFEIRDQEYIEEICDKTGEVIKKRKVTFRFLDGHSLLVKDKGVDLSARQQVLTVHLNFQIVNLLLRCVPCQIPLDLLQKAATIAPRKSKATKNFIFYFCAEQTKKEQTKRRKLDFLTRLSEYQGKRRDKILPQIEECLNFLIPTLIKEYHWETNALGEKVAVIRLQPAKRMEKLAIELPKDENICLDI